MSKSLKNNNTGISSPVFGASYDKINKYNVSLNSFKNQLKTTTSIDELTILAGKIIELEYQIVAEKTTGYKKLEEDQKDCLERVERLKKELRKAEEELTRLNNTLEVRVGKYKDVLQGRIDNLCNEYNNLLEIIGHQRE